MGARAVLECLLIGSAVTACDILPRSGDTRGVQERGEWEQHGHLVVQPDPRYTVVYLRVDTVGVFERHDVVLARFDFDPSEGEGDEYSLTIALDIGDARARAANHPYALGARDSLPAFATVTCLCRPLRPDSVRGTYTINTRGSRQLAGRIDATLYFTAWDDPTRHATYPLRQRIHGVRP